MNFALTDEQKEIRNTIRKFVAKECPRNVVSEADGRGEFPATMLKKISEMGFCSLTIAEEYGGVGLDVLGAIIVVEELSAIYPALAGAFISVAFCGAKIISDLGSEEQKQKYLPGLATGSLLFTYGLTEPQTETDFFATPSIQTTALGESDHYLLNGSKSFVRLANQANYILTLARTDKHLDEGNALSVFIVDMKSPGISVKEIKKVGFNGLSLCEVVFDNVSVPLGNILGGTAKLNLGAEQLLKIIESENLEIAACSLGIAQGAYDYAVGYAKERVQFGRPIIRFGAIQEMLVDTALNIQATRLLTYQAGWEAAQAKSYALEALMARAFSTELTRKVTLQCLQILGGYGYTIEYDAQRYVRDSLVLLNGGSNSEVMKNLIGSRLGLS